MSNVAERISNADIFGVPVKPPSNNAQEQEVKDCAEFLKIEFAKFRRYKILLESIEECIDDDHLDSELSTKIRKIIHGEQVFQTRLNDTPNTEEVSESILGITFSNNELTYSESDKLLNCLKSNLKNKSTKLKIVCYSLFDKQSPSIGKHESPLDLAQDDIILLDYRHKLMLEQEIYMKSQIDLLEVLEELKNIRLKTVPEVTDQKYQECSCRTRINYLKSQLARDKYRIDIFMESTSSLKAYTELLKDIKEQHETLILEIERLKYLKKQYADVSCKEYNDILKSYLQYKSSLEKKKLMHELYG